MKRTFISALVVLTLALPMVATPVMADSARTPVTGTEHMFFGVPARVWTAGPWLHIRDLPLTGTFNFGTIQGDETQIVSARLNPATGDGIVWGNVTYTDSATGVVCSGVRLGTLNNYLVTAWINATCSDGSRLRGILRDTSVVFLPGAPFPSEVYSDFNGTLRRH